MYSTSEAILRLRLDAITSVCEFCVQHLIAGKKKLSPTDEREYRLLMRILALATGGLDTSSHLAASSTLISEAEVKSGSFGLLTVDDNVRVIRPGGAVCKTGCSNTEEAHPRSFTKLHPLEGDSGDRSDSKGD